MGLVRVVPGSAWSLVNHTVDANVDAPPCADRHGRVEPNIPSKIMIGFVAESGICG